MAQRILMVCLLVGLTGAAQAALIDRGGGMIYDNVLDITWLQDANFGAGSAFDDGFSTTDGRMTWDSAVAWADSLMFGGFDDWRLPSISVSSGLPTGSAASALIAVRHWKWTAATTNWATCFIKTWSPCPIRDYFRMCS